MGVEVKKKAKKSDQISSQTTKDNGVPERAITDGFIENFFLGTMKIKIYQEEIRSLLKLDE